MTYTYPMSSYKKEDPGDILVYENSGIEEETANPSDISLVKVAEETIYTEVAEKETTQQPPKSCWWVNCVSKWRIQQEVSAVC